MRHYGSLRGRREFALAIRRGSVATTRALTIHAFAPGARDGVRSKVGVIVPRTVGKAVVRNLVKRRCKAILDAAPFGRAPKHYVVRCKPEAATLSYAELQRQLLDAFVRTRDTR